MVVAGAGLRAIGPMTVFDTDPASTVGAHGAFGPETTVFETRAETWVAGIPIRTVGKGDRTRHRTVQIKVGFVHAQARGAIDMVDAPLSKVGERSGLRLGFRFDGRIGCGAVGSAIGRFGASVGLWTTGPWWWVVSSRRGCFQSVLLQEVPPSVYTAVDGHAAIERTARHHTDDSPLIVERWPSRIPLANAFVAFPFVVVVHEKRITRAHAIDGQVLEDTSPPPLITLVVDGSEANRHVFFPRGCVVLDARFDRHGDGVWNIGGEPNERDIVTAYVVVV